MHRDDDVIQIDRTFSVFVNLWTYILKYLTCHRHFHYMTSSLLSFICPVQIILYVTTTSFPLHEKPPIV